MKTKIKQHIFKAVTIEIAGALLVFSLLYTLFFGLNETVEILCWLWLPILISCTAAYVFGWVISNWFTVHYNFKKWQGVAIIFSLLIISIIAGVFALSLANNNDINDLTDVFPVILIFLLFGGLPTLVVGFWLGKQLEGK
ncbi:hypothetical protein [Pedobacter punctiformis]|uniref:Uncharacterized protein n=1 Tax=Pedobacter punctiformis TaxID=3004097 RepID=A0ABT4LDC3_9SPHI|nr:hypothetical protein [Pedobacter sp. HCMS5-2]MCZ4245919.1 hypothetical protein [Pedobacter sp. HCMS5-2]